MNNPSRILSLVALIPATLLVYSCAKKPVPPPPVLPQTGVSVEQRECAAHCLNKRSQCIKQHDKLYQSCSVDSKREAKLAFDRYVTTQLKHKKKIKRSLHSFLDLSQCGKPLDCSADYKQCYANCGL